MYDPILRAFKSAREEVLEQGLTEEEEDRDLRAMQTLLDKIEEEFETADELLIQGKRLTAETFA